ncbi:MAG: LysR family transcriptional regulator [Ruminococcaceae bacterium]|nr:LysR family transcriptional regulator [Oscillospiraceae bacterium]
MTIQQCRYVLEIARRGSFHAAANALFVAQTGISAGVKQLEQELNIRLFERSNKGVTLTREGEAFVRYAESLVGQADFMLENCKASAQVERVSVSTQHFDFVAEVFGRFLNEWEGSAIHASLRENKTYDVIRETERALCDVGIIAIKASEQDLMSRFLEKRHLTFFPLIRSSPHVFLRKTHPLAGKKSLSAAGLKDFPYLHYEQGANSPSLFAEELYGITCPEKNVGITDRATLMNLLVSTDGYTVGTGIMPSELNGGKILAIPFESQDAYVIGYLLRGEHPAVGELTRCFLARLTAFCEKWKRGESHSADA